MDTFLTYITILCYGIIVSVLYHKIGYNKGFRIGYEKCTKLYEKNPIIIIKYVDKPIYINPNALRTVTLTSGYTENKV